jgi:hypothetical protein
MVVALVSRRMIVAYTGQVPTGATLLAELMSNEPACAMIAAYNEVMIVDYINKVS